MSINSTADVFGPFITEVLIKHCSLPYARDSIRHNEDSRENKAGQGCGAYTLV